MSEQAPERPASGRGGGVFTRRIGPLPMWQWLLIALGLLGVYVIFEYRKKNAAANASQNSGGGAGTGGTTSGSQVPQFVNQTYTTVTPPVVNQPPPNVTINNPPPPGPPVRPPGVPAPAPAQPLSMPPAAQGTLGPPPNIRGLTLGQAITALQQAGWGIHTVSYANQNLPSSQYAQYANTPIYSAGPVPGTRLYNIGLQ